MSSGEANSWPATLRHSGICASLANTCRGNIETLKRRNPKGHEYRKVLKGTGERLTIAKQILASEEARASHCP